MSNQTNLTVTNGAASLNRTYAERWRRFSKVGNHRLRTRLPEASRTRTRIAEDVWMLEDRQNSWFLLDSQGTDTQLLTDANSFHRAIKPALFIAECFGLMPVLGITGPNATALRFSWLSMRAVYSVLVICCVSLLAGFWTWVLLHNGVHFSYLTAVVFYGTCACNMLFFLVLASEWPGLMVQLHRIELALNMHYGYPRDLARKIALMSAVVLPAAVFEHGLYVMRDISYAVQCARSTWQWVRIYLEAVYYTIFQNFSYSPWLGVSLFLIDNLATFAWNYMDLFMMIVSAMLARRFQQVNARILAADVEVESAVFWRQVREDYASLTSMVDLVDRKVSKIMLLSFWNNLYFVCLQLYNAIRREKNLEDFLYFYLSLSYLLIRATVVCLYAASVNDESKRPITVLYSVPSDRYCDEVHRFLVHATGDEVALTALNFFFITRTMLLTVVGTIVTYEMVMVQLNDAAGDNWHVNTTAVNRSSNPFCDIFG